MPKKEEAEDVYELYWEGPFSEEQIKACQNTERGKAWKIYALYQSHPMYGMNSLVYIGKAKNGALERIESHLTWFDGVKHGGSIYVASAEKFKSWDKSSESDDYTKSIKTKNEVIILIEKLLIFALQPTFNSSNKKSAPGAENIRLFSTGNMGKVPAEISGKYHIE